MNGPFEGGQQWPQQPGYGQPAHGQPQPHHPHPAPPHPHHPHAAPPHAAPPNSAPPYQEQPYPPQFPPQSPGMAHPGAGQPPPPVGSPQSAPPGGSPQAPPNRPDAAEAAPPPADGPQVEIIDTSSGRQDGLNKCPKCGATEVVLRTKTGTLMCEFCRYEWNEATMEEAFGLDSPIPELVGIQMGSGATRIQESTADVVTLKCGACGADVVVNTAEAAQSRCHWCRNMLSIQQQIPNGAVPDGVLPFSLSKEQAVENIRQFVNQRKFFAHPQFVKEFAPEEVVGVYMPYLTMDASAAVELNGTGEITTRTYTKGSGDNKYRVYDADIYKIGRKFKVYVDDVLIESSQMRANQDTDLNTNNVINAIQPFDVKGAVTYNANYLRGYTSERRDLDVAVVEPMANGRVLSVARARAGETIRRYDRGVRWEAEQLTVRGSRWVALYVPVWLYSYYEVRAGQAFTHYVAVNGRTGETMGSVPVRKGRLFAVSAAITVLGTIVSGAIGFAWLML